MEPNKIDNQIRQKLNGRAIQPTAQAWDRLDAMLALSEAKKVKKNQNWIFVAASIVLFFGLGYFLFNANETTEINNSVPVVTTSNEEIDTIETNKTNEISVKKEQPVLVQNEVHDSKKQSKFIKTVGTNELIKEKNIIEENPTLILQQPSTNTYKYVSPENLLAEAHTASKSTPLDKKTIVKPRIKVDAASLLTSVEKELDDTHKESTLDKLSKKIQDAKSALVNRNYE
jgi:hypothetical protein